MRKTGEPAIGFLTLDIGGSYNYTFWKHIANAVAAKGANLVSFCGGILYHESALHRRWNRIYDLASRRSVDGLIVLSGSISQYCGYEKLSEFLKHYHDIPMVSLGVKIEGIPSVVMDNARGMRSLMEHMLDQHGVTRPFFLSGPVNGPAARMRSAVFTEELKKRGMRPDPELIADGEFRLDYAVTIIQEALAAGKKFDTVIAANDDMALGALNALRQHGLQVPDDVALSGFDDSDNARNCDIPLTTCRQPQEEMAGSAVDLLYRLLQGETTEEVVSHPATLVVRKSCGCLSHEYVPFLSPAADLTSEPTRGSLTTNVFLTKDFTALAESDTPWELPDAKRKELWTSFCVGVNEKDFEPTLRLLDRYLREEQAMTHERFVAWHNAVILWHRLAYRWFLSDPDTLTALEDFFEKAHLTVADAEKNSHARIQLQFKQREFMIILFSSYFTPISDLEHFVTYIAGQLPNFGVMGAYVAMFTEDDYSKARLLMYFTPQGETYSDPTGITVDSPELLPEQVNPGDHYNLIVEPLLNYDNIIGYLILQVKGPLDFIENIRQILSNGLISIILVQEVMKDKQLKDLLIDLQEKQQELQKAYTTLKENQSTMLVIEKMASLGRMTAGIAHEMNTPIATIRTALTELSQLIDEYDASIGDGEVTPADHREIAAEMRKSLVLADKASEKAAGFVRGIKAQTRDLDPKDRITFNAVTIIREALQLLEHRLKYGRTEAVFEPDRDDIKLFGVPGRLAQIITNLVNNAIDACADVSRGMVHLTLTLDGNETILTVSDNGAGIAPEHLTRIFDPMFTTKPFSVGTGLGLTLVHDIITADFGGKIDVASSPGKGTTFTIRFPDSEAQGAVNGQEIQS